MDSRSGLGWGRRILAVHVQHPAVCSRARSTRSHSTADDENTCRPVEVEDENTCRPVERVEDENTCRVVWVKAGRVENTCRVVWVKAGRVGNTRRVVWVKAGRVENTRRVVWVKAGRVENTRRVVCGSAWTEVSREHLQGGVSDRPGREEREHLQGGVSDRPGREEREHLQGGVSESGSSQEHSQGGVSEVRAVNTVVQRPTASRHGRAENTCRVVWKAGRDTGSAWTLFSSSELSRTSWPTHRTRGLGEGARETQKCQFDEEHTHTTVRVFST